MGIRGLSLFQGVTQPKRLELMCEHAGLNNKLSRRQPRRNHSEALAHAHCRFITRRVENMSGTITLASVCGLFDLCVAGQLVKRQTRVLR